MKDIDARMNTLITDARNEAEAEKKRIIEEANKAADRMRTEACNPEGQCDQEKQQRKDCEKQNFQQRKAFKAEDRQELRARGGGGRQCQPQDKPPMKRDVIPLHRRSVLS